MQLRICISHLNIFESQRMKAISSRSYQRRTTHEIGIFFRAFHNFGADLTFNVCRLVALASRSLSFAFVHVRVMQKLKYSFNLLSEKDPLGNFDVNVSFQKEL